MVEEFGAAGRHQAPAHPAPRGAAQAMLDIIAGNVPFGSMTWSSAVGQIRAGKGDPASPCRRKGAGP